MYSLKKPVNVALPLGRQDIESQEFNIPACGTTMLIILCSIAIVKYCSSVVEFLNTIQKKTVFMYSTVF